MSESKIYTLSDVKISESVKTKKEDTRIEGFALTDKPKVSKGGKILIYRPLKNVSGLSGKIEDRALDEDKLKALIEGIRQSKAKVFTFSYQGPEKKEVQYLTTSSKDKAIDILLSGLAEGYAQATTPSNHLKIISEVQTKLSEGAGEAVGGAEATGGEGGEEEEKEIEPAGGAEVATGGEGGAAAPTETEPEPEPEAEAGEPGAEGATGEPEAEVGGGSEGAGTGEEAGPVGVPASMAPSGPGSIPSISDRSDTESFVTTIPSGSFATAHSGPPPPASSSIISEDEAKKALKQNPEAEVNVALIGPDTAKEQKEKGIIYKEQFNIVFSDRSGVRALTKFEQSEEGKEGMKKTPDKLFMEAEDIRKTYEDQLRLPRLVYSQADNKKDLVKQWNELNVLKAGVIQNLTSGKSSDPLKNYDSIGVVVDVSSLGMSLQDFLNYVQQKGLTPESQNQANNGNYRLTGLKKPLDLDDVAPKEEDEEKEGEGPPVPKQATEDPAQKMEVLGKPEFITNERVKGRVVSGLFKKPKEQAKTQRIRVSL